MRLLTLVLRRELIAELPSALLLGADLSLLIWVYGTRRYHSMIAFVAEAVALVLTLAPRLLENLELRALAREKLGRAAQIAGLRELLVPGRAAADRRRQLLNFSEARAGRADAV